MNIIDTKEERSEQSNPTKAVEFPVKQRLIRIRLVMEMTGISKSWIESESSGMVESCIAQLLGGWRWTLLTDNQYRNPEPSS